MRSRQIPEIRTLRRRLLRWYRAHRRDLPWRRTREPWAILVSEVMLHQTRVEAVIPHYERFLRTFPDPGSLAKASEREVLACWSGLGYYQRARNLRLAAGELVREHEGRFPRDRDAAVRLPGVGRYTAGAVLSIAYGIQEPVVDGNIARVISRLFAVRGDVQGASVRGKIWRIAASLVPRRSAADWNQALMELGALVCLPRRPGCERCPVERLCAARGRGIESALPETRTRKTPVLQNLSAAVVRDARGRVLLVGEGPGGGLVKGLLEPPWVRGGDGGRLQAHIRGAYRVRVRLAPSGSEVRHAILQRTLRVCVWKGRTTGGRPPAGGARWVQDPSREAISSLARKILAAAEPAPKAGAVRSGPGRTRGGPKASSR